MRRDTFSFLPRLQRNCVLVVEDDADQRALYADFLSAHGYDVIESGDGEEALRSMAAAAQVDVILLDIGLPRMSGEEFVQALERRESHLDQRTPIIVITGRDASVRGAFAVLSKPAGEERLLATIEAALTHAA